MKRYQDILAWVAAAKTQESRIVFTGDQMKRLREALGGEPFKAALPRLQTIVRNARRGLYRPGDDETTKRRKESLVGASEACSRIHAVYAAVDDETKDRLDTYFGEALWSEIKEVANYLSAQNEGAAHRESQSPR